MPLRYAVAVTGCDGRGKEPNQSFQVLRSSRQEKLFADELHATQAESAQPDLILQLREQRLYFLASTQGEVEFRCLGSLAGALSCTFMDMNLQDSGPPARQGCELGRQSR